MLSVCIIVKNEQDHIEKCLESIIPLSNDIIIADTGSTDNTINVIKKFNCRLFQYQWNDSFADARNFTIEKSEFPWIFIIDADEVLDTENISIIKEEIRSDTECGFIVGTRNYVNDKNTPYFICNSNASSFEKGCGYFISNKIRLFRNIPEIRFHYPIHELVMPSFEKNNFQYSKSIAFVHHYGYLKDIEILDKKNKLYLQLCKKKCYEHKNDFKAWFEYAAECSAQNDIENAFSAFKRSAELNPENAQSYYNMAKIYEKKKDIENALINYDKALDLKGSYEEALFNKGKLLELCLRFVEAENIYLKCIQLFSRKTLYYNSIGLLYIKMKKFDRAEEYFKKGIELDNNDCNINANLGILFKEMKIYDKALHFLKKSAASTENLKQKEQLLYYIARIYEILNDIQNALFYYLEILKMHNIPSIHKNIGMIYIKTAEYDFSDL